jgi:hypothetical protein
MKNWAKIKGFEGLYKIHISGKIVRLKRLVNFSPNKIVKKPLTVLPKKVVRPRLTKKRYLRVDLSGKGNKKYRKFVHVLVAEHFLPNPDNKPEVNHKDLDKSNNWYWNLEWVTRKENIAHAYKNGAFISKPKRKGHAKLLEDDVRKIKASPKTLKELAQEYKVCISTIGNIKNNKVWVWLK